MKLNEKHKHMKHQDEKTWRLIRKTSGILKHTYSNKNILKFSCQQHLWGIKFFFLVKIFNLNLVIKNESEKSKLLDTLRNKWLHLFKSISIMKVKGSQREEPF